MHLEKCLIKAQSPSSPQCKVSKKKSPFFLVISGEYVDIGFPAKTQALSGVQLFTSPQPFYMTMTLTKTSSLKMPPTNQVRRCFRLDEPTYVSQSLNTS